LTDIVSICRLHPQLLIFLSIAIGYAVGQIKVVGFSLGSTASVLLAALVLGQIGVEIDPLLKSIAFALFIFTIGYKVGPQFFGGLKKEGLSYIILALFVAIVGLVTAVLLGKLFGFNKGTVAGLLSGAMTQSSIIGTAEDAVRALPIDAAHQRLLNSDIAVAYAITYIFGVAGLILFYKIVPRLLKIDLKAESQKLEASLAGSTSLQSSSGALAWNVRPSMRIYRVMNKSIEGKQLRALKDLLLHEIKIEKIKRGNQVLEPMPTTTLQVDDLLLLLGMRDQIIAIADKIGPEVDDPTLAALPTEMLDIYVANATISGNTAEKLLKTYGSHCVITIISRQGHTLPLKPNTIIEKGDMLQVMGLTGEVETFAQAIGHPEHETKTTDLVMVGLGCFLGTLLGIAMIKISYVSLTLGVGGGVLFAGLFFGWLRSIYPIFGGIPDAAQWLLSDFGLNVFIACVGLTAGPRAIHALQTQGATLFLAGVAVTLTPHIFGLIFGKFILRLDSVLLLGALTGAGTATPSLNVLKNECDSSAPALGYTVPYAIGNFVLTIWGTVVINFM
jgi:putative transport protein